MARVLIAVRGPWIALTVLQIWYGSVGQTREAVLYTVAFGSGLVTTTLLVLQLMRLLGYRLVGPRGENPFGASPTQSIDLVPSEPSPADPKIE